MGADALIVVGLTGKYCAGKNFIASSLEGRNLPVIDVDRLGHQALQSSQDELIALFGREIIAADGKIDRKVLRGIVFSNQRALRALEGTVHPKMRRICMEQLESYRTGGTQAVVINAALLSRMHLEILCDVVCFVATPLPIRLARAMQRDGATISSFIKIASSQRDISVQAMRGVQNLYIVKNWGTKRFIHRQVDEFCATMHL